MQVEVEATSLLNRSQPRPNTARRRRNSQVLHAAKSSILRGVPVLAVLNTSGELLRPARTVAHGGGTAASAAADDRARATYVLSIPTTNIRFFISHNWENSPSLKFLAILWGNNRQAAFAAANVAALCWSLATYTEVAPRVVLDYDGDLVNVLGWSSPVYSVMFLVGLRYIHLFTHRFRDELYFLDKACIHQTHARYKAEGIASLGSFLNMSDRLLLLWTPTYFTRLWCNYECSCFLDLKGAAQIDFVPLALPLYIVVSILCTSCRAQGLGSNPFFHVC
jgi:hypothetical protein